MRDRTASDGRHIVYLAAVVSALGAMMGIATASVALALGNIVMKVSPAGQATAFLAASSVVRATCGGVAPVIGGLCAAFFAAQQVTLAFTRTGSADAVTVSPGA
jgi:hypothetical protein